MGRRRNYGGQVLLGLPLPPSIAISTLFFRRLERLPLSVGSLRVSSRGSISLPALFVCVCLASSCPLGLSPAQSRVVSSPIYIYI